MLYASHGRGRPYQDEDEYYYARPQGAPPARRRTQDVYHYHRHAPPDVSPRPSSDYPAQSRTRRARSSSASRVRSKSSSPRRHSTAVPPAPPVPQPSLSEREALARQRLQSTFEAHVFHALPTHLLRLADMTLVTRAEIWETFRARIESPSEAHLAKLVLEQDEEARNLGVSVIDPQVVAPFTEYVRAMISLAIFSHRWGNGEPLFHELPNKRLQTAKRTAPSGPGYQKLLKLCEKARSDYGCDYVWSDTCCINKESSAELEEAILSMGTWYSEAGVCIVHLADSSTLEDLMSEPWFTRGWTLQELLLPRKIRFYGRDWSPICPAPTEGRRDERARDGREDQRVNDKDNDALVAAIATATGIHEADLRHFSPGCTRVADKMRWASQRATSRIEDAAYALLGLFDVSMPIAYGDGPRAFDKLVRTLAAHCTEPDFFAWAGKPSRWSLALPSSPQCFGAPASSQVDLVSLASASALGDPAYELTKLGLRTRLVLVPAYGEPLESTEAGMVRMLLTPALALAQEPIQTYVPFSQQHAAGNGYAHGNGGGNGGYGSSRAHEYEYEYDPRDRERDRGREREREREREFALGVVDYDVRPGPAGYAALHAGRPHLCLVLERERRGRAAGQGWIRVTRPGALSVRFRDSELLPVESVCLLHRAAS